MPPSKQPMNLAGQLVLAAFFIAMLLPLVGSKFINGQIQKEQILTMTFYGQGPGTKINARAEQWFRLWAIQSGLLEKTVHAMDPKPVQQALQATEDQARPIVIKDSAGKFGTLDANGGGGGHMSTQHFWYWWITAAFSLIYFAMLRLSTLVMWLPMLVPLIFAIVITGSTTQRLKWFGFGGVNPFRYRAGVRLANWSPALAVGCLFLPGALPPVVVPALILSTFAGVAMLMSHRAKPV